MRIKKGSPRQNIIGSILLGLVFIPLGVFYLNRTDVECGTGQVMVVGDVCDASRLGRVTQSFTYEERKAYWVRIGWLAVGGGVVALGAAGWFIAAERRRKAAAALTPYSLPPA